MNLLDLRVTNVINSRTMINLLKYFGELDFVLTQTFLDKEGVQHYTVEYDGAKNDYEDNNYCIVQFHEKHYGVNDVRLVIDYEIK